MSGENKVTITELADPDSALVIEMAALFGEEIYTPRLRANDLLSAVQNATHKLVALDDNKNLVGAATIAVADNQVEIDQMAVVGEHQGRKIGSQLVKAAEDIARAHGAETLISHPLYSDEFFEKLGFTVREVEDDDGHYDVLATKSLKQ